MIGFVPKGWVRLEEAPWDLRKKRIRITPKEEKAAAELLPLHETDEAALYPFSEEDRTALTALLWRHMEAFSSALQTIPKIQTEKLEKEKTKCKNETSLLKE